jgi:DNA-binding MarR family transcriptional regulator
MAARRPTRQELASELGTLIFRTRRRVWNAVANGIAAQGASIFSWQLLLHVVRCGGGTQRELAELTAQHPAGVSRALEELEAQGLVRRRRDERDRRKVRVEATPLGEAHYRRIFPGTVRDMDAALRPLSHAERVQLRALLRRIADSDGVTGS